MIGPPDLRPVNLARPAGTLLVLQTRHSPLLLPSTPGEDSRNGNADLQGKVPCSYEKYQKAGLPGSPGPGDRPQVGVSQSSVTKYTDQENYSPEPSEPLIPGRASVLTGFEHIIEARLGEDQFRNRK